MTSITLPSATGDWIDQTPFVCAHQIAEQYALQKQEVHTEKLYRNGFASLASSVATYPIQQGVPFLRPEDQFANLARPDIRSDFYAQHYQKRSRTIDLRSGYLADAQKFVAEFVTERHIKGIVLDVGCGTGIFADCSTQYLGMDYSSTSVFAEGFEAFRRFVGDAQCIPLADSSVELIISYNTLEHVPNPAQAFWEINRILKPGGLCHSSSSLEL